VTKEKFGNFALSVAGNNKVKQALYDNYLYKPAKRIFSLGFYSGEENTQGE
jgi:hypothetical protein